MKTNFKSAMTLIFLLFSYCVIYGKNVTVHSLSYGTATEETLINSWLKWIPDTGFTTTNFDITELQETIVLTLTWTTSLVLEILIGLTADLNYYQRIINSFF